MFKRKRRIYIEDYEEFNKYLGICKHHRVRADSLEEWQKNRNRYYYIEDKEVNIELTYSDGFRSTTYIFRKDGELKFQKKGGDECFALLQRMSGHAIIDHSGNKTYHKTKEEIEEEREYTIESKVNPWRVAKTSAVLYVNPNLRDKWHENCYGYDINSAFTNAMKYPMPDTSKRLMHKFVGENEVGFKAEADPFDKKIRLVPVFSGAAPFIFPLVDSPFCHFADFYYEKKRKAKDSDEKELFKEILNYAVGYIRRKDPFTHAMIVGISNLIIEQYIDENTIYCNTDSIVSLVPRDDIPKESDKRELGKFKLEHTGRFCYHKGYQWNNETPSVRGIPKKWWETQYPNGFDILKDKTPHLANPYYIDLEEMEIKINEIYDIYKA